MARKKRQPIQADLETRDKLKYIAQAKNQSMTASLKELIDFYFQVAMNFDQLNTEFEISILSSTLTIRCSGKSRFYIGNSPPPEPEQKVTQKLGTIQCDLKKKESE
jgi:hypothetical protein